MILKYFHYYKQALSSSFLGLRWHFRSWWQFSWFWVLLCCVVTRLPAFPASLVSRITPLFFLIARNDFILISGIVRIFAIFAGLVNFGVSGKVIKIFHSLFDLLLGRLVVFFKGVAEGVSDISIDIQIEVVELVLTVIWAAKWYFKGEAVDYVQIFPEGNLCWWMGTLAAPSLSFWTSKQQSLNWNTLQFFDISIGNICSLFDPSLVAQPSAWKTNYIWKYFSSCCVRGCHSKTPTPFQLWSAW